MPKPTSPRVYIELRGGYVYIFADPGVRIWCVDSDHNPHARPPKECRTLPEINDYYDLADGGAGE